jgi:3-isopropylmalate dehydratase small subunit
VSGYLTIFTQNLYNSEILSIIMSQEKILELQEQLIQLERKIKPLEWDFSRNQINEFRLKVLENLKVDHENCLQELNKLEQK